MDELLRDFLTETTENLDVVNSELVRFEQEPNNRAILDNVFRLVHTIKGTCGFLGLPRLEALTHAAETLLGIFRDGAHVTSEAVSLVLASIDRVKVLLDELERLEQEPSGDDLDLIRELESMASASATKSRPLHSDPISRDDLERALEVLRGQEESPATNNNDLDAGISSVENKQPAANEHSDNKDTKVAAQSIRVQVETLEHIMTMVSELVLTRNQLNEIVRRHQESEFKVPLQRLSNVTAELQEGVLKTRMQPIGNAWQKLPRIVRDLSAELGKPIELEMYGSDTELDRQVLDLIRDPLTHMVRNSAAHGLEAPEQRRSEGKPESGTIRLSAYHQGGHIIIEVSDDGRGLDIDKIKAKAVALGLTTEAEAEKMTDAQAQKFIFMVGFSTAGKVTNVAGRGIGMDVVRTNIDEIGGSIDVKSVPGRGTTFTIKIPLTLAIISALIVEVAGDRFAIPQIAVAELVRAGDDKEHRIEKINGAAVLRLRRKLLPLVHLNALLAIADPAANSEQKQGFVVVAQVGGMSFGIVVDRVLHTEEIVVKPMSGKLRHIPMFSGTTILGDGSVILIIDPNGVARTIAAEALRRAEEREDEHRLEMKAAKDNRVPGAATESLLVFRAASPVPKAIPMSLVTRLENVDAGSIEMSNGRPVVQYRGQLIPLVAVNSENNVRSSGNQPLLVFSDERRSMGLIVDQIVDIIEDEIAIDIASAQPGVIGSAVVKGHATEIVDIGHYLSLAFDDWSEWRKSGAEKVARSVLLVDDVPFFRNMLAPVLKAAGYQVTAASSARDALALLDQDRRFDVVVTDIEMPEMDGLQLAAKLRDNPRTAEIPVIGLVSQVSPETVTRGEQAGLRDYVAKFDRQGLIAALREQAAEVVRAA